MSDSETHKWNWAMENDPAEVNGINETTIPYAVLERLEEIHHEAKLTRLAVQKIAQALSPSSEEDQQDS